jgi:hypothetical protein
VCSIYSIPALNIQEIGLCAQVGFFGFTSVVIVSGVVYLLSICLQNFTKESNEIIRETADIAINIK